MPRDHPPGVNNVLVIIQQGEKANLSSQGSLEFQSLGFADYTGNIKLSGLRQLQYLFYSEICDVAELGGDTVSRFPWCQLECLRGQGLNHQLSCLEVDCKDLNNGVSSGIFLCSLLSLHRISSA